MFYENIDKRLINGDIDSVSGAVRDCLESAKFEINKDEHTESTANIMGSNPRKSPFILFLLALPQKVDFRLKKVSEGQVQIEIEFGLFLKFRFHYFFFIIFSLLLFGFFLSKANELQSLYPDELTVPAFYVIAACLLIAVLFFFVAVIAVVRLVNTKRYRKLIEGFYEDLEHRGFTGETVLRCTSEYPDLFKGLFVFISLLFAIMIHNGFLSLLSDLLETNDSKLIFAILTVLGILLVLLVMMLLRPVLGVRLIFCLVGISLCLPVAILGNAPLLNFVTEDIVEKIDEGKSALIDSSHEDGNGDYTEQPGITLSQIGSVLNTGLLMVAFFWVSVAGLILFLLSNLLQLPIRITHQLGMFYAQHPDSIYNQALRPEKSSWAFSIIIVALWISMSIAILTGLFFSLSVSERLLFSSNSLFVSDIASSFYDNTYKFFSLLILDGNSAWLHRIVMTLYATPLTLILFIVIAKNIFMFFYSIEKLLPSRRFRQIEASLKEKVKEISMSAGTAMPVIRIIKSPYINSEIAYLGFPFYKNLLLVYEGAWNELKDNEVELEALLAHEVWHQKKHNFKRKLLCTLSDYTLFGYGFLALLQNSYAVEKEADDFAVEWLEKKLGNREKAVSVFESLLKRQMKYNKVIEVHKSFALSATLNFGSLKDSAVRKEVLDLYNRSSALMKLWVSVRLLFQMYFSNEIISYFHPSYEQRKAWIEQ